MFKILNLSSSFFQRKGICLTLISCPQCAKGISPKATSCPNCGEPMRR
ncbi:MAG: zinc ribbon domain-containing protein [Desulfuromonadales bacterium]